MLSWHVKIVAVLAISAIFCALSSPALAFIIDISQEPWFTTASGTRTANGQPVTLTWGFIPDGTNITDSTFNNLGGSDLIAKLDAEFGSEPNQTLMQRPWFEFFDKAFKRWEAVSGATYTYVDYDDGAAAGTVSPSGVLGIRADLRIGGAGVDGSSDVLAFNYFPDHGDMVLDTDDISGTFADPSNQNRAFRNIVMHEHGHGFGIQHVESTTDQLLLEPNFNDNFDGPQLDDIRAIQYYFGDANEKTNGGSGNQTAALATSLGTITSGGATRVGSDGAAIFPLAFAP